MLYKFIYCTGNLSAEDASIEYVSFNKVRCNIDGDNYELANCCP